MDNEIKQKNRQELFNETLNRVNSGDEFARFQFEMEKYDAQHGVKIEDELKVSSSQFQRILNISKTSNHAIKFTLEYGKRVVSLTESQVDNLLVDPYFYVRELVSMLYDLNEKQIETALNWTSSSARDEKENKALKVKIIKIYSKSMSNELVKKIQLRGIISECSALWLDGRGDSPVEIADWMLQHYNVPTFEIVPPDVFNAWYVPYVAQDESDRLKSCAFGGVDGAKPTKTNTSVL